MYFFKFYLNPVPDEEGKEEVPEQKSDKMKQSKRDKTKLDQGENETPNEEMRSTETKVSCLRIMIFTLYSLFSRMINMTHLEFFV